MLIVELRQFCVLDQFLRIGTMLETTFLRLGITAMTALAILFIVSLRGIRTRAYELFFYTHFVAVL